MSIVAQAEPLGNEKHGALAASRSEQKTYVPATFRHTWIPTQNEILLASGLDTAQIAGDGCFVEIAGPAGIGKTTLIRRHASFHQCIYLLCWETWRRSELPMLQALCRELGVVKIPARANDCANEAVSRLLAKPQLVFFDEIDLVPKRINLIRHLAEVVGGVFVLIGEESLTDHLSQIERVWSRTSVRVRFEPASASDIIAYAREAAGLQVSKEAAAIAHKSPKGGDWRIIKRTTIYLVQIANAYLTRNITAEMMRTALDMSLTGKINGLAVKGAGK